MPALGRYELLRPLARGGMADVYLARRRVGGVEKRLVIKRLRRDRHRDPRFLDMFIREAQLSMSLVQQNIVPVFDFGRIGDHVFLAMEHIDGRDLGSSLAKLRGSGLAPILAAFIAAECCQALDHAHRRKDPVIHRDVTPRNVLLSWDGEVKLADFGIAAVVGEAAGNTFGTPGYMAPEQANGERVDARADVYALGLVLWESLTGDHVRPAGDRIAALTAARSGELPELPTELPPALASILRRATAIDPATRFPTARAMGDELDGFMVLERAREGGQAPAKRLAEWLTTRWGEERDEAAAADALGEGGAVVTFLDDGEDGVRGTYTARSVAETAADDGEGDPGAAVDEDPEEEEEDAGDEEEQEQEQDDDDEEQAAREVAHARARTGPGLRPRAGTTPPALRPRAGTVPPQPAAGARPRTGSTPPPPAGAKPRAGTAQPVAGAKPRARTSQPVAGAKPRAGTAQPVAGAKPRAGTSPPAELESPAHALLPSDAYFVADSLEPEAAEAHAADAREPAPASAARRRWLPIVLALIAAAALAYAVVVGRRGAVPAPDAAVASLATADATAVDPPALPDAPLLEPATPDADIVPIDAARVPADAAIVRPPPRLDAGPSAGSARPAGVVRPIWINALPWAYFTIDDDAKQHETPAMLNLSVGAHRITFTNPQLGVSRTVTVTVPAAGEARHVEKMN